MINIAIDGPSSAGKSTVARKISERLGFIYADTGALYRAIGLYAARKGANTKNADEITPLLKEISIELKYVDNAQRTFLNSEDVSSEIRTHKISMAASDVSSIPQVRDFLIELQRNIAKNNNIIMDGRDIGTIVLPDAQVKIFLTAKPSIRAARRHGELTANGTNISYDEVLKDLELRDYNDSHRAAAPLRQADTALLVDTSDMDLDAAVSHILSLINLPQRTAKQD